MDAIQLLVSDHHRAREGLEALLHKPVTDMQASGRSFARWKKAFQAHNRLEEELLYPALLDAEETADLVEDAIDEHQEIKQVLSSVQDATDERRWLERLMVLKRHLDHHLTEEEAVLFRNARRVLSREAIVELGGRMVRKRGWLLKRW